MLDSVLPVIAFDENQTGKRFPLKDLLLSPSEVKGFINPDDRPWDVSFELQQGVCATDSRLRDIDGCLENLLVNLRKCPGLGSTVTM